MNAILLQSWRDVLIASMRLFRGQNLLDNLIKASRDIGIWTLIIWYNHEGMPQSNIMIYFRVSWCTNPTCVPCDYNEDEKNIKRECDITIK